MPNMNNPYNRDIDQTTGLSFAEQKCMDAIVMAYHLYNQLPLKQERIQEFTDGIHKLQGIVAVHAMRRNFPNGWR